MRRGMGYSDWDFHPIGTGGRFALIGDACQNAGQLKSPALLKQPGRWFKPALEAEHCPPYPQSPHESRDCFGVMSPSKPLLNAGSGRATSGRGGGMPITFSFRKGEMAQG